MKTVLISGAGIAGSTLAYWLTRHGFEPTVVERAQGRRSSGSPVDVRGPAREVAERMGVLAQLRAAATRVTRLSFVDGRGRRVGGMRMRPDDIELPRADLARVLSSTVAVECLYDDTVTALRQDPGGVDVTFENAAPRRFDLVVGADGLHSAVRRLAFGPEERFADHLGMYVATLPLPGLALDPHEVVVYNSPGRAVALHPGTGQGGAAFFFRSPAVPGFDHRDTAQHKRLLAGAFAGGGWRIPELLEQVPQADDLFFDSVSRVRLESWSNGRIALLGDAASCVSLFGDGSTLAIAGAATLADALAAHRDDHVAAFRAYEARHRLLTGPKQRFVVPASRLLIPATRYGIAARNAGTRLLSVVSRARAA
ncbi:FAD-dependent monooxygenase [Microbispora sp. ATCC PTA-5024]|uniref:FAD-dependent monooxygenase n=1 Tax=Microbispora sp. ATCC PTA-5024 TaxID=316330 RepID=UPI0003DBEC8B|nr:FAD-dependent monooxygenase [Microbispora sp. ATCC PTA-5024]ETK31294.1 monooxygenase [Microbispora sp. ATCC PTA-5024]